jgi:hypothetical protein
MAGGRFTFGAAAIALSAAQVWLECACSGCVPIHYLQQYFWLLFQPGTVALAGLLCALLVGRVAASDE